MTNDIGRITLGKQLLSRIPVTIGAADLLAHDDGEPAPEPIAFDPVPRRRNRRAGWSEQVQRDFIACLQRAGCVSVAARAVGRSASSAYRLLTVEGAESFALAWDQAVREGLGRLREDALDRALNGSLVPVYRKGRLVRIEHRRNDRLALALLSGRRNDVKYYRNDALNRHAYAMEMKALDEQRAAERKAREEAERAYQEELDRMLAKAKAMNGPRIRRL
jgi:hypothetical protein